MRAYLVCPNGHEIPIRRPSQVETDSNLRLTSKENQRAVLVCPRCEIVSAYLESDIENRTGPAQTPSQPAEDVFLLFSIQAGCDGENCEPPKTIHIFGGNRKGNEGAWVPAIGPEKWNFHATALCERGHKLRIDPKDKFLPKQVDYPF